LFTSVGFQVADADTVHAEVPGETMGEFVAPLNLPKDFPLAFNYLVKTEAQISILDDNQQEIKAIDLSSDGLSIGEHEILELKKGEYTVKENYTVIGTPDSPFLQGQLLEGKMNFDWQFTAADDGIYDYSITADVWDLTLNLTGDFALLGLGETGASIPVQIATTRDIKAGEKIKHTGTYKFKISKTSGFELISKAEEPVVTFVVTGIVRRDEGTVVPNAAVTVSNEATSLSEIVKTDDAGIYKVTFVGPQGSILAQTGDVLKISVNDTELSYTIVEDDISKTRSIVNITLGQPKITPQWDINQDGIVDILDLMLVVMNYGKKDIIEDDDAWAADVNGDKMIDISDLVLVGKNFGE